LHSPRTSNSNHSSNFFSIFLFVFGYGNGEVTNVNIYTSEAIYYVDRQAEEQGFSLFALMENAGRNIFDDLISHINERDHIVILVGRGNSGGDGIVLARYLCLAGYEVRLCFPLG